MAPTWCTGLPDMTADTVPVVLIPSQLLTRALWNNQIAALSERYSFIHADHGQDDTMAGIAQRLLDAVPGPFALVAHGMGGFVAFEVMRRAGNRVTRLVLMSTLATADGPAQTARRQGYLDLVTAGRFADIVDERVPILLPPQRQNDPALVDLVRKMALDTGPERFLRQQRAIMARVDSRPDLPAIVCPTLILRGSEDGISTLDQQAEMAGLIPNARFVALDGCGHLLPVEAPAAVSALMAEFLG